MKIIDAYAEKLVKVPSEYHYVCDNCGYVIGNGERKITYIRGCVKHACYTRPCSPFSKPKGWKMAWSTTERQYVWEKETI